MRAGASTWAGGAIASYRGRLDIFRHADAELRVDVLAEERNLGEAGVPVHGDCFGLPRARFRARCGWRLADVASASRASTIRPPMPRPRTLAVDIHAFDFGDAGFDQADGAAAHRFAIMYATKNPPRPSATSSGSKRKKFAPSSGISCFQLGVECVGFADCETGAKRSSRRISTCGAERSCFERIWGVRDI